MPMNTRLHIFLLLAVPAALGLAWGGYIHGVGQSWETAAESYVTPTTVPQEPPSNYEPSAAQEAAAAVEAGVIIPNDAIISVLEQWWPNWLSQGTAAQVCQLVNEADANVNVIDNRWWGIVVDLAPYEASAPGAEAEAWAWLWSRCATDPS
jgi:hypothetical protein